MRRVTLALVCAASGGAIIAGSYIPARAAVAHSGEQRFCSAYAGEYADPSWATLTAASHGVHGARVATRRAFTAWRETLILNGQPWEVQDAAVRVFTACGIRAPS